MRPVPGIEQMRGEIPPGTPLKQLTCVSRPADRRDSCARKSRGGAETAHLATKNPHPRRPTPARGPHSPRLAGQRLGPPQARATTANPSIAQSAPSRHQVTIERRQGMFLKVPPPTCENLVSHALGPKLASLLVGLLVALRDLLTEFAEGRRRCRPSRAWFLDLLRHCAALLVAPLGRLATGRMRERGTQAVETASHTRLGRLRIHHRMLRSVRRRC